MIADFVMMALDVKLSCSTHPRAQNVTVSSLKAIISLRSDGFLLLQARGSPDRATGRGIGERNGPMAEW
jgi:hypothetical protein